MAREQEALSVASAERALAQAEAQAMEREQLAEAARRQEPLLVAPLNTAPPLPEFEATAGGAVSGPRLDVTSIQPVTLHITLRPHARYSHGCHLTWPGTVCAFWLMYMIVPLASI